MQTPKSSKRHLFSPEINTVEKAAKIDKIPNDKLKAMIEKAVEDAMERKIGDIVKKAVADALAEVNIKVATLQEVAAARDDYIGRLESTIEQMQSQLLVDGRQLRKNNLRFYDVPRAPGEGPEEALAAAVAFVGRVDQGAGKLIKSAYHTHKTDAAKPIVVTFDTPESAERVLKAARDKRDMGFKRDMSFYQLGVRRRLYEYKDHLQGLPNPPGQVFLRADTLVADGKTFFVTGSWGVRERVWRGGQGRGGPAGRERGSYSQVANGGGHRRD